MSQIKSKFIEANAIDDTKVKLTNNGYLKARNAANNADVNIVKVNASDVVEFASLPLAPGTAATANAVLNKGYLDALLAAVNGIATLDGSGKLPASQLTVSAMEYKGTYNATTDSPNLDDGTGNAGDFYLVATAGTQDFGSGNITLAVGDAVIYSGSIWQKVGGTGGGGAVTSVNTQTGAVVLDTDDISEGTAQYFTTERAQDSVGAALTDTNSVDLTYNDGSNTITADVRVDDAGPVTSGIDGLYLNIGSGLEMAPGFSETYTSLLLHFDSNVTDSSSNAFTITQDGATAASYASGKFGNALDFTAANTGFSAPNDVAFQFGSGDFTVECWLKPSATVNANNHQFLNKSSGGSTDWFWNYYSQQLTFGIPNLSFQTPVSAVSIEDGNYHHVAITRTGGFVKTWVDGALLDTTAISGSISNSGGADIGLGHYKTNFSEQYFGYMDEVRISKGIARYTAPFTPPGSPFNLNPTPAKIAASAITTSSVAEGTNLYFTDARARTAAVADAINNGTTNIAPSQNAVFDALALKADATLVKTWNKENLTLNGTDITNQYKDLAQEVTPNSLNLSVGGVVQYEGLDYSLSTVALVTRITFLGQLATGGAAELISGDILRCQYVY